MTALDRKVFRAARIWDGRSDRAFEPGYLALDGERIFACEEGPPPDGLDGWAHVNLGDVTVIPGIIDVHVHLCLDGGMDVSAAAREPVPAVTLRAARHAAATVHGGVTAARDCGSVAGVLGALREGIGRGLHAGPRLQIACQWITMTGGYGYPMGREADGIDDCRRAAREQLKAGADFIKIVATGGLLAPGSEPGAAQLELEELAAAVGEARKAGKPAAAHAIGPAGIKQAVLAGVRSIEHGYYLTEELAELMVERDVYLVPTLTALGPSLQGRQARDHRPGEGPFETARRAAEAGLRGLGVALRSGVKVAMGTDAGLLQNNHGDNLNEIEALVNAGMRPVDALRSATSAGAALLGLSGSLGTLEPGKQADLIALRANPLEDASSLPGRVCVVVQRGKIVRQDAQGVAG